MIHTRRISQSECGCFSLYLTWRSLDSFQHNDKTSQSQQMLNVILTGAAEHKA